MPTPPFTQYIPSVTALAEQTVLAYISSSLYNGGQYYNTNGTLVSGSLIDPATQFYTGIANTDVEGPAILVACNSATEVVFQSRVYRLNLDISTRMMAYDSSTSSNVTSSAISLGGNVASLFSNTPTATQGINNQFSGLAAIQVQVMDFKNEKIEDSWISNINCDLIATLVQS
jgi:hypothetical protein